MKKLSKGFMLIASLASLGLLGCSDDSPWRGSDSEGGINLNLSTDGRVMRQTRAEDHQVPVLPDVSAFNVSLSKSDGSYSNSWSSVEGFNHESGFPIGDYNIEVACGDLNTEGFDCPHFKGKTDVHVSPGASSEASIVATLANSMVSVRYTDAFKSNFPAYSASVQSEGHEWVIFTQNEQRPAFMTPSKMTLNLSLTNASGNQVTVEPAYFTALPKHHYVVTVDVNGDQTSGNFELNVVFDEDVVAETVKVPLGDDLFTAPAPTVTPVGFDPDRTLEGYEYLTSSDAEMHVFAFSGLKSAKLNVISKNGYLPFGPEVELVDADGLTQQQLVAAGVDAGGFFKNVDKMGVVRYKDFVANLPAGEYEVELHAVDAMTRVSDPVKLKIALNPVTYEFGEQAEVPFFATEVPVTVVTNCDLIKDKLSFKVPDSNNRMVEAPVKNVSKVSQVGDDITYRFVLESEPVNDDKVDVQMFFAKSSEKTVRLQVDVPEFSIEADAYTTSVLIRVSGEDPDQINEIRNNLTFLDGDTQIATSRISHDSEGIITITGFNPKTKYSNYKAQYKRIKKAVPEFTTENNEVNLTNGNFEATTQTINIQNIQVGGQFRVSPTNYTITSAILRSTPDGWGNINDLTCNPSSNPLNTWFVVPSTFVENGEVTVQSVGYNHKGKVPDRTGGSFNTHYYCENSPADADFEKAAGQLYLGTSAADGVIFTTRPAEMSFYYKYAPMNGTNEKGEVDVKVYDASGLVISHSNVKLGKSDTYQKATLTLPAYGFGKKAARVAVCFRSTEASVQKPAIYIPQGSELNEGFNSLNFTNPVLAANAYHAFAVGSVLNIKNVTFSYSDSPVAATSRRGKK